MLRKNKSAFSIVIAMILVVIMLLVAYNLLGLIVPYAKNTKGIENATIAYYNAYSGLEESVYEIANNPVGFEKKINMPVSSTGTSYSFSSNGDIIPTSGNGNSEFDKDWNKLAPGEPVQLYFQGNNEIDWIKAKINFRVPDFDFDGNKNSLANSSSGIISWQLSGSGYSLNPKSSSDLFGVSDINQVKDLNIGSKDGLDLEGTVLKFSNFYKNKLGSCKTSKCSLKLSIINDLFSDKNQKIPYIEYKINFGISVPEQFVEIETKGKSYGYSKTIKTKYRVETVGEAFDFTIFQ